MDWSAQEQFIKLQSFARASLAQINGEDEAEEEYYDEEEAGEEGAEETKE